MSPVRLVVVGRVIAILACVAVVLSTAVGAVGRGEGQILVSGSEFVDGKVGEPFSPHPLSIYGGTPPYTLVSKGTLMGIGVNVSLAAGGQIEFKGTPTKAGAWWWSGVVKDKNGDTSDLVTRKVEFFDTLKTVASVEPPNPGGPNYYYWGPGHCCVVKATLTPTHFESGSPYGHVTFYVDHLKVHHGNDTTAELTWYPLSPGQASVTIRTAQTINAGTHTLTARFDSDSVPSGVTGLDGFTQNPFKREVSPDIQFTVVPSPTETTLSEPALVSGLLHFTVEVANNTTVTGGGAQVEPGGTVELLNGTKVVDSNQLPADSSTLTLTAPRSPGPNTYVAKYVGTNNELASKSSPVMVTNPTK
jgi:hypothetical protein